MRDPFEKMCEPTAPIDLSLVSHIINDTHLKGTFKLVGNSFARTASYLDRYIASLPEAGRSEALVLLQNRIKELIVNEQRIEAIRTAKDVYEFHADGDLRDRTTNKPMRLVSSAKGKWVQFSEQLANSLLSDEGGSISLPGGWTDPMGGHAMIYLFKPTNQGLDFYIYNTGAGIQYHAPDSTPTRELYSPVLVYHVPNPIDKVKLTAFISQLLLARLPQIQDQYAPYFNDKRLYEEIFPLIYDINTNKKTILRPVTEQPLHLRTGGQLSGTCSQAVLHQLLKEGFPDDTAYKQFIYQFKQYALDDYMARVAIDDRQDPGVQNLIKHALRTLGRILVTEGLFDEPFIDSKRQVLKRYWNALKTPVKRIKSWPRLNDRGAISTHLSVVLPSFSMFLTHSSPVVEKRRFYSKIAPITGGFGLLQQMQSLLQQCQELDSNHQFVDIIEGLEQVFSRFPLPSTDQAFDTPLDFYEDITQENQAVFYERVHQLQTVYNSACRGIRGGPLVSDAFLPRQLVVGLSVMSVLDYIQNRLSPWGVPNAILSTGTLHAQVTRFVNHLFKSNINNPWFATHDPVLDARLQTIRTMYFAQQMDTIPGVLEFFCRILAGFPAMFIDEFLSLLHPLGYWPPVTDNTSFLMKVLEGFTFDQSSMGYYLSIIDSEPTIKQQLEDLYTVPDTLEGRSIDSVLRYHGCRAFYVLSSRWDELRLLDQYKPLIRKFEDQRCLEQGIFTVLYAACGQYIAGNISVVLSSGFSSGMEAVIYSPAARADSRIGQMQKASFLRNKYSNKGLAQPSDKALALDFNRTRKRSDNDIQLHYKSVIGADPVANRQFLHLRNAPSLQIRETLHYFNGHLDKLSDRRQQIYMEANLFQPGLLLDELDSANTDDILQQIEHFVAAGLEYPSYRTSNGQCTQPSLFFIRMAHLVYDYAAKHQLPQAMVLLESLQQRLTGLLDVNKDNTSAIKHTLHHYLFLTAMSRLRHQPALDPVVREGLIVLAMTSLFFMNASSNPEDQLDRSTQFDLSCIQHDVGHLMHECSPQLERAVIKQVEDSLGLQGLRGLQMDMTRGLIFNHEGCSLTSTPLHIVEYASKHYPDVVVPATCFVNKAGDIYEMGVPKLVLRYRVAPRNQLQLINKEILEKLWTVNDQRQWYVLCDNDIGDPWNLPLVLRQRGTHIWVDSESSKTFFVSEKKRPIYRYDPKKKEVQQLDAEGRDNGYILCLNNTWIHDLLSPFESPAFITVCKKGGIFKAELSRYGLTLLAQREGAGIFTSGKWVFRLENHLTYTLVRDASTQRCLNLPGLPDAATLIFEEEQTQQRRCYIPVQPFVATNTRSPHSEFYYFEQDIRASVAKSIVEKALPGALPTSWRFTNTEQCITFLLNEAGVPQPETAYDALYLCYVYLGHHRPEHAWAVLDEAKRLGGLKGTAADIALLQMIAQALPIVLDAETHDAPVATPPYVACQLKALALLVCVMTPDKKIDFPITQFDANTPDGVYKNKQLEQTKAFYDGLNTEIFKLYSRYQSMHQDMTHEFHLLDEEKQRLLEYYHFNLPREAPKAMGALGYERQQLNLKMLLREEVAIEAKRIEGQLPVAYEQRLQEIRTVLDRERAICGHHGDVVLRTLDCTISPHAVKKTLGLCNITAVPNPEDLRCAMDALTQDIKPARFSNYFPLYFRLLITSSDNALRKKLVDFCYQYWMTHRHVKPDQQTSIAYLCNILYRIDYWFGLFSRNLAFASPLVDNISSVLPSVEIAFKTLFDIAEALPDPVIEIYEVCDTLSGVLPLNSAAWAREIPVPSQPIIARESTQLNEFVFEKLLSGCVLDQGTQQKLGSLAQAYQEQAERFGAAPVELTTDFASERQAGIAQGMALHAMKTIAVDLLTEKTYRDALQKKAKEWIGELDSLIKKRINMALNWANSGFESTPAQALHKDLSLDNGVRAPLTQEQLLALYFKADKAQYAVATGLSDRKIEALHFFLTTFLALSVRRQSLQRFVDKSAALTDDSPASAKQLVAQELLTEDVVNYKTEPVMALFQYYENMLLRPQQKAALERMVATPDGFSYANRVEKIIMGGGKSKVILPLLAQKKANGTNLVVIEVPRGLFETNVADLSNTSGRLFDQKVFAFDFNRETNCSPESLAFLHSRLINVIVQKDYVVTTGDAVQSLELKYLELLLQPVPHETVEKKIWEAQVEGLDKLVNLFRTRADAVIDEVHQALLLKKKLNYTLGDGASIPPQVIQKTVALYDFLDKVPLNDAPDATVAALLDNNQRLTHDEDWKRAMQQLAHMLVRHEASPLKPELEHLTEEEIEQIHSYLLDQSGLDLPNGDAKICNLVARYKEQVNHLLPLTLRRNLNEHYGASHLHPDAGIAIPYLANNEPSERSRFGNHREAMNFTIQMFIKEGLSSGQLLKKLRQFQEQAALELMRMPHLLQMEQTPTGQLFHSWVPEYPLSQINLKDENAFIPIFHALRYNRYLICDVLEHEILPQQTIDSDILYSNAHTHVEIYHSIQGLTGTPDFSSTWHSKLTFDKQTVAATNGFIIHLLEEKKTPIRSLTYTDPVPTVVHNLLAGRENVHAIMDICAAFKGTPNEAVAYALADYLRETNASLRYVLFFNQANQLCALNTQSGSKPIVLNCSDPDMLDTALGCRPEQRFSYYDQVHTLGTDLKQAPNAKALALVDHETQLQNFLQGAMRMRGLANEQSLEIIVPKALDGCDLDGLLNRMEQNQERQLKQDNFAAAKSKMSNHVRAHIMTRVLACSTVEEKQALVMQYRSCFVEQAANEADFFRHHGQLSSMQNTRMLLEEHRDRLLALDSEALAPLKQGLNTLITDALPLCQDHYLSTVGQEAGREVEVQQQVEVQQEQEQEQEQELELMNKPLTVSWYMPWLMSPGKMPYTRVTGFLSLSAMCQCTTAFAPDFSGIYVNANYYQTYVDQTSFLGAYLKPVHALLFRKSIAGKLDCVILSQQEAQALAVAMKKHPETDVWISNTAMTLLAGQHPAGIHQDPGYQELIEKVRFFSGEFKLLLKGDIPLNWLRHDTEKKMAFFKKELYVSREAEPQDVIGLQQALSDQQAAFDYIVQNPSLDYTASDWWNGVSQALSLEEPMQKRFADLLKVHPLKNITEAMCEQSADVLGIFLDSNHFKTDAGLVKAVLETVNQQTSDKVIATLSTMEGVSPGVRQVVHEHTVDSNFYFKCLAGMVMVGGGAILVVGLLALNPVVCGVGVGILVAGAAVMLGQCGFFKNLRLGVVNDELPVVRSSPS